MARGVILFSFFTHNIIESLFQIQTDSHVNTHQNNNHDPNDHHCSLSSSLNQQDEEFMHIPPHPDLNCQQSRSLSPTPNGMNF